MHSPHPGALHASARARRGLIFQSLDVSYCRPGPVLKRRAESFA